MDKKKKNIILFSGSADTLITVTELSLDDIMKSFYS
ncbi:MAG: hypothetical protein BWY64_03945 [bacterium ADurb.Bin363]|nr:MAG: hypothetical protein BWY64_03945 [bacterium ADurb.Bin363]